MTAISRKVRRQLERLGLLMAADAKLPSVTAMVAGEPVHGSWWGHRAGHAIFAVLEELDDWPDCTSVKLVSGKVTLVHRSLFGALYRVASAGESWQWAGLTPTARALHRRVVECGELRTDELGRRTKSDRKKKLDAGKELEARLLVDARQIHTDTGAHAHVLATWDRWARRVELRRGRGDVAAARVRFEAIVASWREQFDRRARLPWE